MPLEEYSPSMAVHSPRRADPGGRGPGQSTPRGPRPSAQDSGSWTPRRTPRASTDPRLTHLNGDDRSVRKHCDVMLICQQR